jgi:hypothetical protein
MTGTVNAGGLAATFTAVSRFSTIVGLLPNAIPVNVDIRPGATPNVINLKSHGTVRVAIMGTPTFDVITADPATMRVGGRPLRATDAGHPHLPDAARIPSMARRRTLLL